MLIYRWDINRWAAIEGIEIETLFAYLAEGMTLEQLDNISSSIDALGASLDSGVYNEGRLMLAGVNASHKVIGFNGVPLTAEIDTAEVELSPGQLSDLVAVRPLIDGNDETLVSCKLLGRNTMTNDGKYTEGDYHSPEASGEIYFDSEDAFRYSRLRVRIEGGFDHAVGLADVEAQASGAV